MRALVLASALTVFPLTAMAEDAPQGEFTMAAIGDSISTGFNAKRLGDNRSLSWSTGETEDQKVFSHVLRMKEILRSEVSATNQAIAGSVAANLDRQIDRLTEAVPDYTTITIGANDVCSWGSNYERDLASFESKVDSALGRLIEMNPEMKIMLSPIPNMLNLWEVSHDRGSCQFKWDFMGICRPLLGSDRTDEDRANFQTRWQAANAALAKISEQYTDNVRFESDLANVEFAWEDVSSTDCFHPSIKGQNLYSEETWAVGWYATGN